jgi:hypothetical protein
MHSLKTWSRLVRISCSVLQHCGKRHWLNGTLPRTPYICIACTAWCAKGKALLKTRANPTRLTFADLKDVSALRTAPSDGRR